MVPLATVHKTGAQVQMQSDLVAGAYAERQLARGRVACDKIREHGAQGGGAQPLALLACVHEECAQAERG